MDQARVLNEVVQRQLLHAAQVVSRFDVVELEQEGRLVIQVPEGAQLALEADAYLLMHLTVDHDLPHHPRVGLIPQRLHLLLAQGQVDRVQGLQGEELRRLVPVRQPGLSGVHRGGVLGLRCVHAHRVGGVDGRPRVLHGLLGDVDQRRGHVHHLRVGHL